MACGGDLYCLVFVLLVVSSLQQCAHAKLKFPCFFIFGDSLVDNGNNNNLETLAKVNYPPYGIDYPSGTTGRFSNGRTMADILAQLLGFDQFIPSFTTATGSEILKGVNYASGSAGIRDETGQQLGNHISLNKQLQNHQTTMSRMVEILGNGDLAYKHLKKCLYTVGMGSNDYLNNYFVPQYYQTSKQYTQEQYADVLIQQYCQQLKILYDYGAREVAVSALGPIGCTPHAMESYARSNTLCVDYINNAVQLFNQRLKSIVDQLNNNLTDAKFIYLNSVIPPSIFSVFNFTVKGCCEVNDIGQCIPNRTPCHRRDLFLFWDSFHPTEAVNKITAGLAYVTLLKQHIRQIIE